MAEAAIHLEGVTKDFGAKRAVDSLDLVVPTGSVCGFLGPNGAGKTTTIRMIMSIIYPDTGSLSVLGKKSAIESKDRIGYLPEERGVYRKMRVGDFIGYIARLKGMGRKGLDAKIEDWLEKLELPGVKKKRCEELSKGMQQKVQFITSIINDPELIILDEPFSGLDPVNVRLLQNLIKDLRSEGRTIVFSTHVLHSAEMLCDRVFMIDNGRKVLDGTMEDIRERFDPRTVLVEPVMLDGAESILRGLAGVAHAEHFGSKVEIHPDDGVDPTRLMRAAIDAIPVRSVELRRATLEDIFVGLISPGDAEASIRAAIGGAEESKEVAAHE